MGRFFLGKLLVKPIVRLWMVSAFHHFGLATPSSPLETKTDAPMVPSFIASVLKESMVDLEMAYHQRDRNRRVRRVRQVRRRSGEREGRE